MNHYYQNIEGWFTFESIYSEMVRIFPDGSHFVEIGCWLGRSSTYMGVEIINSTKKIKFDCIDSWDFIDEDFWVNPLYLKYKNIAYDEFLKNTKLLSDVLTSYKMNSVNASKLYQDQSLDFIFIDASHTYDNVMDDLNYWYPKLKHRGIIAGHDYNNDVKLAVDEFFRNKKIEVYKDNWIHYDPNNFNEKVVFRSSEDWIIYVEDGEVKARKSLI